MYSVGGYSHNNLTSVFLAQSVTIRKRAGVQILFQYTAVTSH